MSFYVYLRTPACSHCGRGESEGFDMNITHNLNSIVEACLVHAGAPVAKTGDSCYRERSWGRLEGWLAKDAMPILDRALDEAINPEREAEFRKDEPDNGWGHLENVRECFRNLRDACRENPGSIIRTSG